jgi:hypothetical protein
MSSSLHDKLSVVTRGDFYYRAKGLLDLLESDFGQYGGRDALLEAIRCELEAAFQLGKECRSSLEESEVSRRVLAGALRDLLACCEKHPAFKNPNNRMTLGRVERARAALAMNGQS